MRDAEWDDPGRIDAGFGLYVHWPFCLKKCPYCDFNSHVRDGVDHRRWQKALLTELESVAERVERAPLQTIFFGGGTPSLMAPDTAHAVIEKAVGLFGAAPDLEVTLEANPTSVEGDKFRAFAEAGVNRTSVGVQALNDKDLGFLGRQHSVYEARSALDLALETFERVSFDLIYARPGQSLEAWQEELKIALGIGASHLSLYQLTIEPETEFGKRAALGTLPLADEDIATDLFEWTGRHMADIGFDAYETSNHARSQADQARHNLIYWRLGSWAGIGPGAHGRIWTARGRTGTETVRVPERWLEAVEANGHGLKDDLMISARDHAEEMLLMGLRLAEGISLNRLGAIDPLVLNDEAMTQLIEDGFLSLSGDRLSATAKGRPVLNELLRQLIA